jgi:XTP/dITP diphosphohydrolase
VYLKLLLATNNQGKVGEYRELLGGLPFDLVTPGDIGVDGAVEETGLTFTENARLKAWTLRERSGLLTLADDSGLEVDALNGEPGIRSARYAGPDATDRDLVAKLLFNLRGVPPEKRGARFRCVIAVAVPGGSIYTRSGNCAGRIAEAPQGDFGFGYDPVFLVPDLGLTMAELPASTKNRLSHRGRAVRRVRPVLRALIRHEL